MPGAVTSSPARRAVLAEVAAAVPTGAVRVGIDGVDGAGKTHFADDLAVALRERGRPVVRIGVDDFLHPPEHRYRRGRRDPEGFFLDSFDHEAFLAAAAEVYRAGRAAGTVVLVDGLFLQRDELAARSTSWCSSTSRSP